MKYKHENSLPCILGGYADISAELNITRTEQSLPGLSALVMKNGRIVAQGASGYRRQGDPTLLLATDRINLGGTALWMTATLAGRLVDRKFISWTTRVYECFPNYKSFNSAFQNTTFEEFLAHVSGVQNETIFYNRHYEALISQKGNLSQIRYWVAETVLKDPPQNTPGEYWYANQGYVVAAAMMEQLTSQDWESLIQEYVFTPLKMTSASIGIVYDDTIPPQNPVGHDSPPHWAPPIPLLRPNATFLHYDQAASGAFYVACTLQDWATFLYAHVTAESSGYLSPETTMKLQSPFTGEIGDGFSVYVSNNTWAKPGKALMEDGNIFGEETFFAVAPSRYLVVATYTNSHPVDETGFNPVLDVVAGNLARRYADY